MSEAVGAYQNSPVRRAKHEPGYLWFWCPACNEPHMVTVAPTPSPWGWDGSLENPTISPSILVTRNYGDPPVRQACHSFVRGGRIEFLGDCTHAFAGKTVELPEWHKNFD